VRIFSPKLWLGAVAALGLGLSAQTANAGYGTYTVAFNNSTFSAGPTPYALLDITGWDGVGTNTNHVVTMTLYSPRNITNPAAPNDQYSAFGFNVASGLVLNSNFSILLSGTQVGGNATATITNYWQVYDTANDPHNQTHFSAYGDFIEASAALPDNLASRLDSLTLTVTFTNASDAKIQNVVVGNTPKHVGDPSYVFAAHYYPTGTGNGNTGDIAALTPKDLPPPFEELTPAPAGLVLLASAVPFLGLRRVFRRKMAGN